MAIDRLPNQTDFISKMDAIVGAIQNQYSVNTNSASGTITLKNNNCYRIGSVSSNLTIDIDDTDKVKLNFESELIFTYASGTLSYSEVTPNAWTGTDCENGVFVPVANKNYDILFYNISRTATPNIQAIVRGI